MSGCLQLGQDPVHQFELATGAIDVGAGDNVGEVADVLGVRLLDVLEHERVVTKFPASSVNLV